MWFGVAGVAGSSGFCEWHERVPCKIQLVLPVRYSLLEGAWGPIRLLISDYGGAPELLNCIELLPDASSLAPGLTPGSVERRRAAGGGG